MKVLFLDIDGVLNSSTWFQDREKRKGLTPDESHIDPKAVDQLNYIFQETHAMCVISSTWRRHKTMGEIIRLLVSRGMSKNYFNHFIGMTPFLNKERGHEIDEWLTSHAIYKIKRFSILDDDADMVHLIPYLVPCHGCDGLTKHEADKVISMLNA